MMPIMSSLSLYGHCVADLGGGKMPKRMRNNKSNEPFAIELMYCKDL